jgi:hypothetical protein
MKKNSINSKWCDRRIVDTPVYYCLCLDEESFTKELIRLKVPVNQHPQFLLKYADATTHWLETSEGRLCALVTLNTTVDIDKLQKLSLIVHEAVHIWQETKIVIGETNPSKEFEAYSIQAIAQNLMFALEELEKKK